MVTAWVRSLAPSLDDIFADMTLDPGFADRELIGNLLVGIPRGDQAQHGDLAWS